MLAHNLHLFCVNNDKGKGLENGLAKIKEARAFADKTIDRIF